MVKGGGKLLRNKLDVSNFESKHLLSMKEALKKEHTALHSCYIRHLKEDVLFGRAESVF